MKPSKRKAAGIALIVLAILVAAVIQLSGHGYTSVVTHPDTPPGYAANGITLNAVSYQHYSVIQLSMLVPALVGSVLLLLPKRSHAT